MNETKRRLIAVCVAILLGVPLFGAPAVGEPPAPEMKPAAGRAAPPAQGVAADPANVPGQVIDVPNGTPDELLQFIGRVLHTRPAGKNRTEMIANYKEMLRAVVKATDKILADKAANDEQPAKGNLAGEDLTAAALLRKLHALNSLERLGDKSADAEITRTVAKYSDDKRPQVAALVDQARLEHRFMLVPDADAAAIRAKLSDIKEFLGKKTIDTDQVMLAMNLAKAIERSGSEKQAAELYEFLGQQLGKSTDPHLLKLAPKCLATAVRLGLVGKPMEVFGKRLDGQEIDWKSYQGKVVLVDFWATWCRPCLEELPNVVTAYHNYHDRGFEIVGVSLDDERGAVEKFIKQREIPWTILFSDDPQATGWDHPLAAHYGIMAVPTVILVDQQGKVVSLDARGPKLGKLLAKLLGPPAKEGGATPGDKPDKTQPPGVKKSSAKVE